MAQPKRSKPKVRRVLLVEPHHGLRQSLTSLLDQKSDLRVVAWAGSLAECRSIALDEIDVLVTEISLTDGDGIDLIREVRSYGMAVVVMTLNPCSAVRVRALKAGANDVLGKDASFEELVEAMRRALDRGRARLLSPNGRRSDAP